jgi:hypothetical protein
MKSLRNYKSIDSFLDRVAMGETLNKEDKIYLTTQLDVLQTMYKIERIANDATVMAAYLGIIKEQKVNEADFAVISQKKKDVYSSGYLFNISDIKKNHPHLSAYDDVFEYFKEERTVLMPMYKDSVSNPVYKAFKTMNGGFKLDPSREKDYSLKLKTFMEFFSTTIPGFNNMNNSEPFTTGSIKEEEFNIHTNGEAFLRRVGAIANALMKTEFNLEDANLSAFTSRLNTGFNKTKKRSNVTFYVENGIEYIDEEVIQRGFDALTDYEYVESPQSDTAKSKITIQKRELKPNGNEVNSNIQRELLKYTVINTGLSYGSRNYNKALTADSVRNFYSRYETALNRIADRGIGQYVDMFKAYVMVSKFGTTSSRLYDYRRKAKINGKNKGAIYSNYIYPENVSESAGNYDLDYGISNKPRIKSIPKNKLSTEPVYFDMSLDADGVGNPQTYSDTFKDTVTKVIKKGKDGKKDITKSYDIEKKTNYVKVHHEHDRDFYKILSSSNSNSPLISADGTAQKNKYIMKYAVRSDLRSGRTANLDETISVDPRAIDYSTTTLIEGDLINMTAYSDAASYMPKVYKVTDTSGDMIIMKQVGVEEAKSKSARLLDSIRPEIIIIAKSAYKSLIGKGNRAALADKILNSMLLDKFQVSELDLEAESRAIAKEILPPVKVKHKIEVKPLDISKEDGAQGMVDAC